MLPQKPAQGEFYRFVNPAIAEKSAHPSRAPPERVTLFRDQGDSFRKLASVSTDRGATWTTPVVTDMPDSRSKQLE